MEAIGNMLMMLTLGLMASHLLIGSVTGYLRAGQGAGS